MSFQHAKKIIKIKVKKSNANTMVKLITDAPSLSRINVFIFSALSVDKRARSMYWIIVSNNAHKVVKI